MKKIYTLLIGIISLFSSLNGLSQEWSFAQEFTHDFPANGDSQGASMDVDSNRAIIGIPGFDIPGAFGNAGAVLLLEKINGIWQEDTLIVNQNPGWDDYFGVSVAIDDNRIAIGKVLQDDNGNNSGSVVVMEYNELAGIWENPVEFSAPTTVSFDQFGDAVALSGNWLAVASKLDDYGGANDVGSVDIFEYNGSTWAHIQNIPAPTIVSNENFGNQIEMDDTRGRLIISAPGHDNTNSNGGAVYEYNLAGTIWDFTREIHSGGVNTYFGTTLSLSEDRLVFGGSSTASNTYVYDWNSVSSEWDQIVIINDDDIPDSYNLNGNDGFAKEVYIDGERLLISAIEYDGAGSESGSVFVFEWENGNYVLKDHIIPPTVQANQNFGVQVAILGNDVIINASEKNNDVTSHTSTGYTYIYNYCKKDSILNITTCDTYTNSQGMYGATGLYIDTIASVNGCDSVIQLNLTILDPMDLDTTIVDTTICRHIDFTWPDGSVFENVQIPLTQYSTLSNINGCDSVVKTTISFHAQPNISEAVTNATCGELNGGIDVTMTGGSSFDFLWNTGSTEEDLSGIGANTYILSATNEFGCSTTEMINVTSTDIAISGVVTDNPCRDLTVGAIDLTITGSASSYTFEWTNGSEDEDITNLPAGQYDVLVMDPDGCQSSASFTVNQPSAFNFSSNVTEATCGASDGEIDLSISGGNGSYDFDWTNESNMQVSNVEDVTNIPQGLYSLEVSDANGCTDTYEVNVSENGGPSIYLDSVHEASCLNDGALFTSIGSSNGIQSIVWSNADNTEDITGLASGSYSISVTDNSGCVGNEIFEVPNAIPSLTEICLVTVDQNTGANLVVWEKPVTTDISSFVVYRESSVGGEFQVVDTVLYTDDSELTDSSAFPQIRSWKYRIGTINTCGVESQLSPIHKTIHCAISQGLGGVYNIFWDDYEGFTYSTYEVWRNTATNGWEEIQSMPIGNNSFTDTPPEINDLDYYVSVASPNTCSSTKANDYNTSRSNRSAGVFLPVDTASSIYENKLSALSVYPNPFTNEVQVMFNNSNSASMSVLDVKGKTVKETQVSSGEVIDLGKLDKGIYFIEISLEGQVVRKKLIKQ